MRLLRDSLDEAWHLLRLFVVGCAWSLPFVLAAFVNANPGVSSHPRLAALIESFQWPLVLVAPLASVLGIAFLAWLLRDGRPATLSTVLALIGSCATVAAVTAVVSARGFDAQMTAVLAAICVAVAVGALTTLVGLGRRTPWLAATWAAVWIGLSIVIWVAGARTADGGDDLGSGLVFVLALGLVLGASSLASFIAFVGARLAVNLRRQGELAAALDATIEQGHRAGGVR